MKLLVGNGAFIEVYDISPMVYAIDADGNNTFPINGFKIMSDDAARKQLESIKHLGTRRKLLEQLFCCLFSPIQAIIKV